MSAVSRALKAFLIFSKLGYSVPKNPTWKVGDSVIAEAWNLVVGTRWSLRNVLDLSPKPAVMMPESPSCWTSVVLFDVKHCLVSYSFWKGFNLKKTDFQWWNDHQFCAPYCKSTVLLTYILCFGRLLRLAYYWNHVFGTLCGSLKIGNGVCQKDMISFRPNITLQASLQVDF